MEISGAMGKEAIAFFKRLGQRIWLHASEPISVAYLLQQVSVALQRSNAAAILGTFDFGFPDLF